MKYLIGNWKSNLTIHEAQEWIEVVKKDSRTTPDNLKIVLCPSFVHLLLFKLNYPNLTLGAQAISPFPNGAYTGSISAHMLKDLVEYAIVGHSERRTYFKETPQDIANQVTQLIDNQITPIIAVDRDNWRLLLAGIDIKDVKSSIIMYEPPEAISKPVGPIGQGDAAPIDEVVATITQIKSDFTARAVIYGGSVKSHNLAEYLGHPLIDGVLPGSASLNPQEWLKMIEIAIITLSGAN